MKKIITLLSSVVLSTGVFAQAPEKMSYQASIRNASNNLVISQAVGMRISILQGSAAGTAVYVETQTPTTNVNGLVSFEIGAGSVVSGSFSGINWNNGPYFIKTETDPSGGTSYTITGTSQLLSVPYALYAKTAGSAPVAPASITNADVNASAGIAYSKLALTNSIVSGDITANAITSSNISDGTIVNSDISASANIAVSKLNVSGTGSSSNFLRGDGSWAVPTATQGDLVVYTGTSGGTITQTITDVSIRSIVVTFNGGSGASSINNITIPSPSSYAAGTVLYFSVTAYITANPSWTITSAGATYYALNFNGSSMSSGVSVGGINGFRLVSDGVSKWYRLLP